MIKRLSDSCSLLYSDLMQKVFDSQNALLSGGSFVSKSIGGATYWYSQSKLNGTSRQKYLGRETDELLKSIQQSKSMIESASHILSERRKLVAMIGAGGGLMEAGRPAKILAQMSDAGLFSSGGVLVGSFAFSCYGNMLGVTLRGDLSRTTDMDFSVERQMEIGIQRPIAEELVEAGEFAFPEQWNPHMKSFHLVAKDGFKVEFLTTKKSPQEKSPVPIERFKLDAQPLDFMDYLIADPQQSVVVYGAGIPVAVPNPSKFVFHKLAVSQLRPVGQQAKIMKDIAQASAVIDVLIEDNPGSLILAAESVNGRNDLFANHVISGIEKLPESTRSQLVDMIKIEKVVWDVQNGCVKKDATAPKRPKM